MPSGEMRSGSKRKIWRRAFTLAVLAMSALVAAPPEGYRLVWSDEFDGTSLNLSNWVHRTDSKHWSTQKPANVTVRDGELWLALKKEAAEGKDYTGAGVISRPDFQYGYYEARFRVPPGAGWHTSFWLMDYDVERLAWPKAPMQEIDICEQDSVDPSFYTFNLHDWRGKHRAFGPKRAKTPDLSADFHEWACEFTPEKARYFFDGRPAGEIAATNLPHGRVRVWLTSIASHLGKTKAVDDEKLPAAAVFDWVRVYEKAP